MSEDQNELTSMQDREPEGEDANENISQQETIEQTEPTNHTSESQNQK